MARLTRHRLVGGLHHRTVSYSNRSPSCYKAMQVIGMADIADTESFGVALNATSGVGVILKKLFKAPRVVVQEILGDSKMLGVFERNLIHT